MKIYHISFSNLRNHSRTEIDVTNAQNVFYGLNGSGKTTILEAIAICSFSKSFRTGSDSTLISNGESFYTGELKATNDLETDYWISVKYQGGTKKELNSIYGNNLLAKDIIGEIPLVVLSPDLKVITAGSPQDRRDFIDKLLSQSSRIYLEKLMNHKKIIRQRNNLLGNQKNGYNIDRHLLDSYTEIMIDLAADILLFRAKFIKDFSTYFIESYKQISKNKESVNLIYYPNSINHLLDNQEVNKENLIEIFNKIYNSIGNEEIRRGITLFGPQKDELVININGSVAKDSASEGQHKTLLISLKFAELNFLKDKKNETPIVLLDDIFSELDSERAEQVFELLHLNSTQTFITMTDPGYVREISKFGDFSFFLVDNGKVVKTN